MVHKVIVMRDNLHLYFLHRMSGKKTFLTSETIMIIHQVRMFPSAVGGQKMLRWVML